MRSTILRFITIVGTVALVLPLLGSNHADAQNLNRRLKGVYKFSAFRSCIQNRSGFDPIDFTNLDPPSTFFTSRRTLVVRATWTFNGDGTGSADAAGTTIRFGQPTSPGQTAVSQWVSECDTTYTVNPDNSFELQLTCRSETIAGRGQGNTAVLTGIRFNGQIALGRGVLLLNDNEPNQETINSPQFGTRHAICHRNGMAVKVP